MTLTYEFDLDILPPNLQFRSLCLSVNPGEGDGRRNRHTHTHTMPILFTQSADMGCNTVKQEIFTTGKFRGFAASGGSRQENFANLLIEELPSFKMSPYLLKSDNY